MYAAVPDPDRLAMLSEISQSVSATLDLQALYETIYRQVSRVMDTTLFSIALHDAEREMLVLPYIREEGKLFVDQQVPYGNNVTSLVIERGTLLSFPRHEDYQTFARANRLPALNVGEDTREAVMFVPLHTGSRAIGCLSVESKRPYVYREEDLETLSIIAAQAAVAVENARLYQRSQDSFQQMQALLHVAQTINQSLNLYAVLDAILLSMREVMPYAFAAIMLPDYQARTLDIVGSIGPRATSTDTGRVTHKIPFYEGISGEVFRSGEPLVVRDVRAFPGFVEHELHGVYSEMAVPLRRGHNTIGVLDVGREGIGAFAAEELSLLSLFANQAAIAIENARLFDAQRQRVHELQTIEAIVRELTPLHDLQEIADVIGQRLKELIQFHSYNLSLVTETGHMVVPIGTDATTMRWRMDAGFAGWIVRHGKADIIANTLDDPRPRQIPGTERRPESMIGAPLIYQGQVRGVIVLSRLGVDAFDDNDLRLLEIIAA